MTSGLLGGEEQDRLARASTQDHSARSRSDLRHRINRSRARTVSQDLACHEEEASSIDPTYYCDTDQVAVEARIEDLERWIDRKTKNQGRSFVYDHINTKTELHFTTQITRFTIPCKFKQPHLDSYNGFGSPVDHVRTYRAQIALATKVDELLYLAFPSTPKVLNEQWFHSLKPWSVCDFK